jgi:demethylmenaquinone methyltransferase/2-methoxy-6-polyprenyl-1,4-benzoquinol methylase
MSLGAHRQWKKRVIALAAIRAGDATLDVCCGTGDLAFAFVDAGARSVGVDFNVPMLEVAQRRATVSQARQSLGPLFIRGDAQQLPVLSNTMDAATVGYGLRNLADWQAGLREMHRAVKSGGRVLVLDFGKPDNRWWRALYFGYLRVVVPLIGLLFCGSASAYAYILESLKHYPAQHGVATAMTSLGMRNIRIISIWGGIMTINYGVKA